MELHTTISRHKYDLDLMAKYNHEIKKIIIYVNVMMVIYILIFKEIKLIGKKIHR
jgi:hypothetical protein